ncbi:MAG: flavin reductase family protein [Sphaerochaetaceae bacterium]|jgi:ferredoxin-NADP reductase
MAKDELSSLNAMDFLKLSSIRKKKFKKASDTPIPAEYPANALARRLHPVRQSVKVSQIIEHGTDCRTYVLECNSDKGTDELAYFAAGKYITVFLDIDGMPVTRAYSLSSSPKQSLQGKYAITVKYVQNGLASRYILDNWEVGSEVEVSAPEGSFEYVALRDAKTVLCIAGGSGITPFLSMAQAISDGDEDFNMILLYGSRTADSILFKDEFNALAKKCSKIRTVYVLSHEQKDGYEHGFISKELIEKYAPSEAYSVFLCGPQVMYDFVDKELEAIGIEPKFIRHELYGEIHDASSQSDYPGNAPQSVKITVHIMDETKTVEGNPNDTIMQILEKNGIAVPSRCRSGECGWCHSYLKSGKVYAPKKLEHRRKADLKFGYIHPCCTFPLSDLEIEVPYCR